MAKLTLQGVGTPEKSLSVCPMRDKTMFVIGDNSVVINSDDIEYLITVLVQCCKQKNSQFIALNNV